MARGSLRGMDRYFSKEDILMANRYMKTSLIKEMKIKSTTRDRHVPVRMAVIRKMARMWRKGNPHVRLVGL